MRASLGLKRILVVEDEGDLRNLVTRILEDSGYAVEAAEDGWSAIEALGARRPDLMLLDLRLPVLDGWTVLEFARRSAAPPAVALMTVCSDADSILRGLRAGIAAGSGGGPWRSTSPPSPGRTSTSPPRSSWT